MRQRASRRGEQVAQVRRESGGATDGGWRLGSEGGLVQGVIGNGRLSKPSVLGQSTRRAPPPRALDWSGVVQRTRGLVEGPTHVCRQSSAVQLPRRAGSLCASDGQCAHAERRRSETRAPITRCHTWQGCEHARCAPPCAAHGSEGSGGLASAVYATLVK